MPPSVPDDARPIKPYRRCGSGNLAAAGRTRADRVGTSLMEALGMDVHVEDHPGPGPAVVLVHGAFCDATHWRHQVGPLTDVGRRVITLDLPGHGRSAYPAGGSFAVADMASAVLDVIDRMGAAGCVLVGHSYGCRVALEVTDREPSAVAGLVLVDGSRASGASGDEQILAALRAKGGERFVLDLFEEMFVAGSDPSVKAAVLGGLPTADDHMISGIMSAIVEWDRDRLDAVVGRMAVEVLAIQSTSYGPDNVRRSLDSPTDRTPFLRALEAGPAPVSVRVVPGVGHFTMLEAPDEVTGALVAFSHSAAEP